MQLCIGGLRPPQDIVHWGQMFVDVHRENSRVLEFTPSNKPGIEVEETNKEK